MVYYKLVKVMINRVDLAKMIINIIVYHCKVSESIIINQGLLFILKFWFLLYYFLKIKKSYPQLFTYKRMVKQKDKII